MIMAPNEKMGSDTDVQYVTQSQLALCSGVCGSDWDRLRAVMSTSILP